MKHIFKVLHQGQNHSGPGSGLFYTRTTLSRSRVRTSLPLGQKCPTLWSERCEVSLVKNPPHCGDRLVYLLSAGSH